MLPTYRLVCILLFFIPSFSFAQNEEGQRPKYAPWGEKHMNMKDDKGKQGEWKYYTRDRILLYSITYKNDIKNGLCSKYYSSNGIVREESNYYWGLRDGDFKNYFSNGQINTEGTYKENKKTGIWMSYHKSSGEKKNEGSYVLNKKDGLWVFYNSKGTKSMQGSYKLGVKDGEWFSYNSDGKVIETSKYINGVLQLKESVTNNKTPVKTTNKTTNKTPVKTSDKIKTDTTKTNTTPKPNNK